MQYTGKSYVISPVRYQYLYMIPTGGRSRGDSAESHFDSVSFHFFQEILDTLNNFWIN